MYYEHLKLLKGKKPVCRLIQIRMKQTMTVQNSFVYSFIGVKCADNVLSGFIIVKKMQIESAN